MRVRFVEGVSLGGRHHAAGSEADLADSPALARAIKRGWASEVSKSKPQSNASEKASTDAPKPSSEPAPAPKSKPSRASKKRS